MAKLMCSKVVLAVAFVVQGRALELPQCEWVLSRFEGPHTSL